MLFQALKKLKSILSEHAHDLQDLQTRLGRTLYNALEEAESAGYPQPELLVVCIVD